MSRKPKSRKVRVGLLRADTHGYYYGSLMAPTDPAVLMKLDMAVHYYFTSRFFAHEFTRPLTRGFEIVKVWDPDPERAEIFAELFFGKPKATTSLDNMTEGIDAVFIADCNLGGEDHLRLARPFLKKGIPTFVDKPFASTMADAKAMIALAKKHKTPLMNASILSYVPEADLFKRRFPEAGKVGLGIIKGIIGGWGLKPGEKGTIENYLAAIIHGIALGINLFGKGVEWVEAMGPLPLHYIHMHLKNGIEVVVVNGTISVFTDRNDYNAAAYGNLGEIRSHPIGDPEFVAGAVKIVRLFKQMVRTGKPPIPYDDMLEPIAVVEAAQIAQKLGKPIFVRDVLRGKVRRGKTTPVAILSGTKT